MGEERETEPLARDLSMIGFEVEVVDLASLKPHPRNYRKHPEDQVEHIRASVATYGFYKPVVVSSDGYVLAGHGLVEGARAAGMIRGPVHRMNLRHDDPLAIRLLVADNEVQHLVIPDDRALTELLREIKDTNADGLLGTGYDDQMLANLLMVTRTAGEIKNVDAAREWVGMPEFDPGAEEFVLILSCDSEEARAEAAEKLGATEKYVRRNKSGKVWSVRWPLDDHIDLSSVRFEESPSQEANP